MAEHPLSDKTTLNYTRALIKYVRGNLHTEWRVLVDIAGSQTAAVLLRQILYWSGNPKARANGGWFWKTKEDWQAETGLTRRELETAEPTLSHLIETKRKYVAGSTKKHYRLRPEVYLARLTEVLNIGIPGVRICGVAPTAASQNVEKVISHYTKCGVAPSQNGVLLGDQLHKTGSNGCTERVAGRYPPPQIVQEQHHETGSSYGESNKDSNRDLNTPNKLGQEAPPAHPSSSGLNPEDVWKSAYSVLEIQLDSASFKTWVQDAVLIRFEGNTFVIGARNAHARDMCQHRLTKTFVRILSDVYGAPVEVCFEVSRPAPRHNGDERPEWVRKLDFDLGDDAANKTLSFVSGITPEKIEQAKKQYPPAWVDEAVGIARSKGKDWGYVRGTLNQMAKERASVAK